LQEIFANGDTRLANTAARGSSRLLFKQAGCKVAVAGKHGAAANVDPAYVAVDDNKTIHVIDKVLYGGEAVPAAVAAPAAASSLQLSKTTDLASGQELM
jgi:hypothetical protein